MCRFVAILLLALIVCGQPFTVQDIAFVKTPSSDFQPSDRGAVLVAWYKADAGVFEDAGTDPAEDEDPVAQWNDQSGNNRHIGQSTVGTRPLYQTGIQNGLPGVQFISSDWLTNNAAIITAAPLTVYIAAISTSATANQIPIVLPNLSTSTDFFAMGLAGGTAGDPLNWQTSASALSFANSTLGYTQNVAFVGTGLEVSATDRSIYINGAGGATNTTSRIPSGINEFVLGMRRGFTSDSPFLGYLLEVVIINEADDAADRAQMETYLSTKWGL